LSTPRQLTNVALRQGTRALTARDPALAGVVRRFGPPPLWGRRPGFPTLVRIILEQQVSLAAARTMYLRLHTAAGSVTSATIAELGFDRIRALGFTRQKAAYCHELALRVEGGHLDLGRLARIDDETGRRTLLEVRGLGPWSVDIYYLMALRRPDVWPHGDLALAEAASRLGFTRGRADYDRLGRVATRWAPWRSVAARILWHYYLSEGR
jgi:DNA-3-methyladenine glycosylase II